MSCNEPFKITAPDTWPVPEPVGPPVPEPARTGSETVTGPVLAPEPAGSETGSEPDHSLVPMIVAPDDRISRAAHIRQQARRRMAARAAEQKKHRRFSHRLWDEFQNGTPDTFSGLWSYTRSCKWLDDIEEWFPAELFTGWIRWAAKWQNIIYLILVAFPVKAAAKAGIKALTGIDRAAERQSRAWLAIGAVIVIFIVLLATGQL